MMWSTHSRRIDPITVSDHVTGSPVPRKGLGYLMCNPLCCRVGCDADPREVPTIEPHDNEGIEQIEANGRDNKQVHGGNVWSMITQEGSPSLAGWSPSFNHVLGDARLRDFKPELEQFAVDTWRAPKRIFDLIRRTNTRSSVSICGRPPRGRDFQRR